jgi:hypothetical protein
MCYIPCADAATGAKLKHRNEAAPQLLDKADVSQRVADIALPLREECQRLASGLPRLDPPLPGNLCAADEARTGAADAGISDDEQSYSPFHDEDELERELEVHERRLLGSDAGPERADDASGVPCVKPEPKDNSLCARGLRPSDKHSDALAHTVSSE